MAGNVADEEVERIVARRDQAEIAANRANGLVIGGDIHPAPGESGGREALLDAGGQQQVLFDFLVAFLELRVCFAQGVFRALLFGNVRGGDHGENVAVGVFDLARGDENREAVAVGLRKIELVLALSFRLPLQDAAAQDVRVFGRVHIENLAANQLFFRDAYHFLEEGVGEDDVAAIVVDDDALIDGFEDASHFGDPGELGFLHGALAFDRAEGDVVRCKFSAGVREVETEEEEKNGRESLRFAQDDRLKERGGKNFKLKISDFKMRRKAADGEGVVVTT